MVNVYAQRFSNYRGAVSFKGRRVPVSKAFAGRYVALRATNVDSRFDICYRHHRLGQVDLAQPVA